MDEAMENMKSNDQLNLPQELLLMLLNNESGFFYQVMGWNLNCAIVGAVIAELSLQSRIDTDMESLIVLSTEETGDPVMDFVMQKIAAEQSQRSARFWIERLSSHADFIFDSILEQLVKKKILHHHEGDFWTLNVVGEQANQQENIKSRIGGYIFGEGIPAPREVIIIALINTCDVFHLIFQFEDSDAALRRIESLCKIDLIAQSIAKAVEQNIASPLLRRSVLSKKIPTVALHKAIFNRNLRIGNIPALFADLAATYGPVFEIKLPIGENMIFLAGAETNRWAHRQGRFHLRSKDYFTDLEKVYKASGLIPSVDGVDHFRLRKVMQTCWSRERLKNQLGLVYSKFRQHATEWKVGSTLPVVESLRSLVNAQITPVVLSIETQDIIADTIRFKERAMTTHVAKVLPKILLHTPAMNRCAKAIEEATLRVESTHTPAQRINAPRDMADELLSLHDSDPQFFPESNMSFSFSAVLLASMYLADMLGFAFYAMLTIPSLYEKISSEADALFANGDPVAEDFDKSKIAVTRRFVMESTRMYPIIPLSLRNVMNSCEIEGFNLPVGARIGVVHTAINYMSEYFPEPYKFDIDRFLPPRNEQRNLGYHPYGWGTHTCLGTRWMDLHMAVNILLLARYFRFEMSPPDTPMRINSFPSMSVSKKMKFRVVGMRNEIPS